jgi:hypothetical protein
LFMDDAFGDNPLDGYMQGPHRMTQSAQMGENGWAAQPVGNVSMTNEELVKLRKLQVGLYHKTRGGRNTFGAISGDAMVRVTKGVGKRLQLRVEFDPQQLQLMCQTLGVPMTMNPFNWSLFSVTLEELSLANGSVLSEKACELDMTELLTVVSPALPNGEEPTFMPANEHFTPSLPLVAQCELKLFHLSKTLRFRVEYHSNGLLLTGHSLTFFTHDSGKSKKVAFGNTNNADLPSPTMASNSDPIAPTPASHIHDKNLLSNYQQQHMALQTEWLSDMHDVSSTTSALSPSGEQEESSSHSDHTSPHPYQFSVSHDPTMDLYGQSQFNTHHLSSSPSESDDTPMLRAPDADQHTYASGPVAYKAPKASKRRGPNSGQPSHFPMVPSPHHQEDSYEDGHLEASNSSSSGSGLLTPSGSSTLMETDTISRDFNSDHESAPTFGSHAGSMDSGGGFLESHQYSTSVSGRPFASTGSASSSFSSDDGNAHMKAHGARRAKKSRTKAAGRSSSQALSSSTPQHHQPPQQQLHHHHQQQHQNSSQTSPHYSRFASADSSPSSSMTATSSRLTTGSSFEPIDEEIERRLSGRSGSKKRKPSEMMSAPVEPSQDFPYMVDGNLDVQGVVRAQAFVHFSDIRFKTNVEDITDALNIVSQLKGKKYEWKDNINGAPTSAPLSGGRKVIGLIAQEVKRVLPEVVVADQNGFLSLNYTDMVPVLIEALKQHVEASKAETTEIHDSISELRAKVDELSQRSGDSLTDTSSYLDFSDDESLDGSSSFQDEDNWGDLSDSHGSYSRAHIHPTSYRRASRASSISSNSSLGAVNDGDLTASSASLPDETPLWGSGEIKASPAKTGKLPLRSSMESKPVSPNANTPSAPTAARPIHTNTGEKASTPRKNAPMRRISSTTIMPPRPFVTLVACMTHRRLSAIGSSNQAANVAPSPFTIVTLPTASAGASLSPSASLGSMAPAERQANHTTATNGQTGSNESAAPVTSNSGLNQHLATGNAANATSVGVKKSESAGLTKVDSTVTRSGTTSSHSSSPTLSQHHGPNSSLGSVSQVNSAPTSSNTSGNSKEKESAPGSTKRTATQRFSRGFSSFLHHIQTSTTNIMNSAKQFSSSSSSSSSSSAPPAAPAHSSSPSTSPNHHDDGPLSEVEGNLSSSSSSISSNGSNGSPGAVGAHATSHLSVHNLSQQMSALSLSSSASEVRAQVLTPGFNRISSSNAIKNPRTIHRAVVVTVSAWHMWSNADEEKLFLDDSDARHSLVMTGKAVSQIESSFPECSYIHTVSIDMRGTVQQTVEDVLIELQRRQVPSGDPSTVSGANNSAVTACSTTTTSATGISASVQSQMEQADLVWFVGHSQGIQVCVHLCDRLMRNGVLSSGEQLVNILSLGGLHNTCAYSLMSLHGNPAIYAGLHNFGNSRRASREYKQALGRLLETGVPVTTIGAYQDTLVNMSSSSLEYAKHPNILRSLLVHHEFKDKFDPRHAFKKASNFTQEMMRFALEMSNKGRTVDMLAFLNTSDANTTDVQETTSWIAHAKTFPRDKLHALLYHPHIEFPATVPGFYYALGATMSMFNTRAFRFHKTTRQLREGIQRHREIPFAQDCYRVSLEWMITRVAQGSPLPTPAVVSASRSSKSASASAASASSSTASAQPPSPDSPTSPTRPHKKSRSSSSSSSKREAKRAAAAPATPAFPPLIGVPTAFKGTSNGFSFDFSEQVQLIALQCSKTETARLQSAFRYWRPEGPKEILMQKLVTKSLGWSVSESPALAQYVDGLSEIVRDGEKDKEPSPSPSSSSSPANTPTAPISFSSAGHTSPRGPRKDATDSSD